MKEYINIKIKDIGISLGKNEYDNDHFIKHFDNINIDIRGLLKHMGREKRYRIKDNDDNSITLAEKSILNALASSKIDKEDIDGIVFVSDTPEYLFPSNAVYLSGLIGTKNAHVAYDMNANCIGMLAALDTVTALMKSNKKLNKFIIVGSVQTSKVERKDCSVIHPNISDGSVAIILEKIIEDTQKGVINTHYYTDPTKRDLIKYPGCGFSNTNKDIDEVEKLLNWIPHSGKFISESWIRMINGICNEENIVPNNIDWYIFSQFSKTSAIEAIEGLNLPHSKHIFCGDKYGYTGNTSPFLALYTGFKDTKIKEGDKISLSSLGAGVTVISMFYIH